MSDLDDLANARNEPRAPQERVRREVVYVVQERRPRGVFWKLLTLLGALLAFPGGIVLATTCFHPEAVIDAIETKLPWLDRGTLFVISFAAFILGILLFSVGRFGHWLSR